MNKDKLEQLLQQYFDNTISSADCILLLNYLKNNGHEDVFTLINEKLLNIDQGPHFTPAQAQNVLERIKADARFRQPVIASPPRLGISHNYTNWARIAAVMMLFCALGIYFLPKKNISKPNHNYNISRTAKIMPGGNKATLTLANGKTILLDDIADGTLAKTGKIAINKVQNNMLVYNTAIKSASVNSANALVYNTLTTPRGGEYQVILPDGTRVWLNASSSLSYPVEFVGNERHVKLTGEAYFEVAKNKDKPFYVSINEAQVKVLGTHFNISAYQDDDELATTLLEGSVQVSKNQQMCMLKPGQQAVLGNNTTLMQVSEANINEAMAWKNGYFIFNDDNLATIMKKVSRWYNVDFDYQGGMENKRFGGTFNRAKDISELLNNLEKIGKVHFKTVGRRITVMQ